MRPELVRALRERKGWTQKELGRRLGMSQPYISLVERGLAGSPEVFRAIQRLLGTPVETTIPEAPAAPAPWAGPPVSATEGCKVVVWYRPLGGGDVVWSRSLGARALLVGAIDVAGHGPALLSRATYLRGVVDGAMRDIEAAPRMEILASHLRRTLEATGVDAAWCVVVLRLSSDAGDDHAVTCETITDGYPSPLLVSGPPFTTLGSASSSGPVAATVLPGPVRLMLASDGFLRRVGAGDEVKGRRWLLQWQTGPHRDRDPADHLGGTSEAGDDESLLVARASFWDRELTFDVSDDEEKDRAKRDFASRVQATKGQPTADRVLRALSESLSNAHQHAYQRGTGVVVTRLAITSSNVRLEVEDRGHGTFSRTGEGTKLMFAVASHVDVRNNQPSGLIIHVVFDNSAEPIEDA